jgi:hypothetical protein
MPWVCALVLMLMTSVTCLGAAKAPAKQGDLSGAGLNWFYGYYGQLGSRGFFGEYNVDASSTGGTYAPLNAWVGNEQDIKQLVTGTNAAISAFSLDLKPQYGNEWVNLKARYTINPYVTSAKQGAITTISPPNLAEWQVRVNTPLADVTVGKRVFAKGFDLQFSQNRTTEYLLLERSYLVPNILGCLVASGVLPRKVMSWFNPDYWPRRKEPEEKPTENLSDNLCNSLVSSGSETDKSTSNMVDEAQAGDPNSQNTAETGDEAAGNDKWPSDKDAYAYGEIGPGCLRIAFGFFPWETPNTPNTPPGDTSVGPPYFNLWNPNDVGANQAQNYLAFIQYMTTDLEFGVGCLRSSYHQGPELQNSLAARISAPTFERYVTEGWSYIKYGNGRYFFNTEVDWFNRVHRFHRSLNGTFFGTPDNVDGSGSVFASKYWESWRYMAEAGGIFGPFVGRVFYCFMPGPDRRHGVYIDRQPYIQENLQQAFGLFDPYSILLSYRFGSGVNAPGHISDASVYAVKLDYAVASNLIIQGSFLRAFRNSHGYAVGFVRPNNAKYGQVTYGEPPTSTFTNPAPSIPERDLGWEAMAGFVWELMEGWSVSARVSYWRPGKWFNYACVDKSVPNWDNPSPANNWGVRPDRVIDSFLAVEVQVGASY